MQTVPASEALERALELLRAGEVVAVPTETVYGLAGNATDGEAVARIFAAKGRPRFNPLIAHVSDMAMAESLATFDDLSRRLAGAFWPGPLTLVLPLRPDAGVHPLVTAGLDTIALRMPKGFAATLIAALGHPLAAPSANSSGRVSATSAAHVAADLGDRIPLIVDGGQTAVGLESTIVKVENSRAQLLRPGGIAAEAIEAVTGEPLLRGAKGIQAPGMMTSHYAPNASLRLDATELRDGESFLAFGTTEITGTGAATVARNLSPSGDLVEAAANLFGMLHELDSLGARTIAVAPVPRSGLGEAINDRLARAAAPRDGAEARNSVPT